MTEPLSTRLKDALKRARRSARSVSIETGQSPTYIKDIFRGREPGVYRLQQIASTLGVTVSDLLGEPAPSPSDDVAMVPLLGALAAGVWREARQGGEEPIEMIPAPRAFLPRAGVLYAARVEGTSMNKIYPPGSIVILKRSFDRAEDLTPGQRYHVERISVDGSVEETLKTVVRKADGSVWLVPESHDPEFLAPVSATPRPG